MWNDQVLKVFVTIERRKKRKFHTPIHLLTQPQKLIHKKYLLRKVVKVVCFVCHVEICQTMALHIGIGKKLFDE